MESKPWYKSTTYQGVIISMISNVLFFSGIELPEGIDVQIANAVTGAANIVGFIMIIIGRYKAKTAIGK